MPLATALLSLFLSLVPAGDAQAQSCSRGELLQAVAAVTAWPARKIDLFDRPSLDRNACTFFGAARNDVMDAPMIEFARLPEGRIVNTFRNGSAEIAAAVLKACGAGASPVWWADIIVRFSGETVGQLVQGETGGYAVREIERRGGMFHPPVFLKEGRNRRLRFFTFLYEPPRSFQADAEFTGDGRLSVKSRMLTGR